MTPSERLENLLTGNYTDRPPFIPAIYDLKPSFLNAAPHTFGQKAEDIINALTYEAEQLDADALTAAYDIYNVEAEAAGCRLLRDLNIGMPEIANPLLNTLDESDQLRLSEGPTGRMGIFVRAAKFILQKYCGSIPVRGGISGPFTMAARIFPKEILFMETIINPEKLIGILQFCTETIKIYAKAFAEIGAGVIVFDSFVSPPMLPPQVYHDLVLPFHKDIFNFLMHQGVLQRTLIIGGNTLPIIEDIVSTGATQFLLDFTISMEGVNSVLQEYPNCVFRVNLPPASFISKNTDELKKIIDKTLSLLKNHKNIIIGTGILPLKVPPSNILFAKNEIINFYK